MWVLFGWTVKLLTSGKIIFHNPLHIFKSAWDIQVMWCFACTVWYRTRLPSREEYRWQLYYKCTACIYTTTLSDPTPSPYHNLVFPLSPNFRWRICSVETSTWYFYRCILILIAGPGPKGRDSACEAYWSSIELTHDLGVKYALLYILRTVISWGKALPKSKFTRCYIIIMLR